MLMKDAVLPGTPDYVIEAYETLADRAKTRSFGLIEDDVIVLDTETTGLSLQDNKLIEISAARMRGREVVERFDTFVHPGCPIPAEITRLTSITDADVATAPSAKEAVAALEEFVGGCPVIAHNATFDRSFIESVKGGVHVSDIWIDSLALSRIALPRLASHKLSFMADLFGCDAVSHRADADVEALCGVWRILLTALADLPAGLLSHLADMHPDVSWSYRPIFSYLAAENPGAAFSLVAERQRVVHADLSPECVDADDVPNIEMPSREEIEAEFLPGGKVASMYEGFEARAEQVEMAQEVRDAFALRGHRVLFSGFSPLGDKLNSPALLHLDAGSHRHHLLGVLFCRIRAIAHRDGISILKFERRGIGEFDLPAVQAHRAAIAPALVNDVSTHRKQFARLCIKVVVVG